MVTAAGLSFVLLAGIGLIRRQRSASAFVLAWGVGISALGASLLLCGACGIPLVFMTQLVATVALAAVTWLLAPRLNLPSAPVSWSVLLLFASAALVTVKVSTTPVWSWDYFTIWGVKAQRMVTDGRLSLAFLRWSEFRGSNPDYPLLFPTMLREVSFFSRPSFEVVRALHLAFCIMTALMIRCGCIMRGASEPVSNYIAAYFLMLPLAWDTESVGLAEALSRSF